MVKILGVASALVILGTSCVAPALALGIDAAIEQCAIVAAEEQSTERTEDRQFRGFCLRATADYISTLNNSGLPGDAVGVELATYVVQLAQLLELRFCRPDSEIPQAIAMTGDASRDPEQAEQIRQISLTVFGCNVVSTAAIPLVSASTQESNGSTFVAEAPPSAPSFTAPEFPPKPPLLPPDSPTGPPASPN